MSDCPICGGMMEMVFCHHCIGDGGFHECGDDCCACEDPEINEICPECDGEGEYLECMHLPHTDEQMDRWREFKAPLRPTN